MAGAAQLQKKSKTKKKIKSSAGRMDTSFLIIVFVLFAFGLVMLFSASYANANYYKGNSFHYISRQAIIGGIGIVVMLLLSKVNYKTYRRFSIPFFIFCLILLGVVLIRPGDENNIKRWIELPVVGQFQPSELMKIALIALFASMIAAFGNKMKTFRYGVLPFGIVLGAVVVLLYLEPHLSGLILMAGIGAVMMFVGGTKPRWFATLGAAAGAALVAMLMFTDSYQGTRFESWLNPFSDPTGATMQTDQSLLAIGSGGLLGLGLGNSKQKYMYLPEPHNDFIFAIICEELGAIGAIVVIMLFIMFIYKGFTIASKAPDKFSMMLCVGITAQVGIQVALNIAVVTNSIPNTGISLPFFSYGGTALAMMLAEIGIMLNVSRHATMEKT